MQCAVVLWPSSLGNYLFVSRISSERGMHRVSYTISHMYLLLKSKSLPIVFSSIPLAGTKSRVETQIKLVLDLATPVSSSSQFHSTLPSRSSSVSDGSSLTASPPVIYPNLPDSETTKLSPTHDRVGTYSYLRLPYGTTTKRRSTAAGGRCDSNSGGEHILPYLSRARTWIHLDSENTLQVTADVVCCSAPTIAIQSCQSCQAREASFHFMSLADMFIIFCRRNVQRVN